MRELKNKFPGYFIKKPIFQSIKDLKRLLGEQDSCFHTNQVSISFLEEYIKTNNLDNYNYIAELCDKYSISSGHRSWEVTKKLMSRSYIVQTYNIQEIFFKDFNSEYQAYKKIKSWKYYIQEGASKKALDPYSQLIESIPKKEAEKFSDIPESIIVQY